MKPSLPVLPAADQHHLRAAEGWLGLGDWLSANDELEEITAQLRAHPDVLELRWQIYAAANKWEPCVDIAAAITKLAPDRPTGWIHRAYALHELKRTAEARDTLLPVVEGFPGNATLRYNLACYAAQLGDLPAARAWLEQAFAVSGHDQQLKLAALDDPDLEPLWQEIGSV
jgi:predicted Zn-dependent protease